MKPLVTIALATYNVEEYVKDSLKCIISQTFRDIEILCIDDGSSDSTPSILKSFEKEDDRIYVVLKEKNEGLAVSRNEALKMANGRYITFLDGDDLYDHSMIEKAVKIAEKEKSDMVIWDYEVFYNENELEKIDQQDSRLNTISKNNKIELLQRPAFVGIKLIKVEIARALQIIFPRGLTRQDIPVHWHLMTQINNIALLPERLYYYRQQVNATTHKKDARLFDLATVMDITKLYLENASLYNQYKDEFLRQRLNLLFGMYDNVKTDLKPQAKELINERLTEDEVLYISSNKPLRQQARWFYKSQKGDKMASLKYYLWKKIRLLYRTFTS